MSGGSFNYLYSSEDLADLLSKRSDLEDMASVLSSLTYADDAADETEGLISLLAAYETEIQKRIGRLKPVWEQAETYYSSDSEKNDLQKALSEYREKGPLDSHKIHGV